MNLEDLKPGTLIYSVDRNRIVKYHYLMKYPAEPSYLKSIGYTDRHLLVNRNDGNVESIRESRLEEMLRDNQDTYYDCKLKQIELVKKYLNNLIEELDILND